MHGGRHAKTHTQTQCHKNLPLSRTNYHSRTCPFPNWEFFYEKGDYVCMCFRGILSVHGASIHDISNARGDKRGTRSSSWGKRPLTPINPPPPPLLLPPRCVGVMSGMSWVLLSPGALFLVTHHQAFPAAYPASSLPLTPCELCVPWSLTLNRPPWLNTTDRQASGHQVQMPKLYIVAQWGYIQPIIFTCLVLLFV